MNSKGLIVAMLMLATPLCATAERGIVSNSKDVTFSIISPKDGSLWIATESRGLIIENVTSLEFETIPLSAVAQRGVASISTATISPLPFIRKS